MKKALYIVLAVLIVLGGGGALIAKPADASAPGDPLYFIDLAAESVARALTFDAIAQAELEQDILDERTAELDTIATVAGISDSDLDQALEAIDAQSDRVQKRMQNLETHEGLEEGALEQVQNRYEKQVQEHTETMNQVKNEVKNMGEDTQLKLETAVGNLEKGLNKNEDAGSNGSSNGNTDSGGSSNGGSSSGGNKNN